MHRNFPQFWGIQKMEKVFFSRHEIVQVWSIVASIFLFPHRHKSCKYLEINAHSVPSASLACAVIIWKVSCSWFQSPVLIIGGRWTSFSWWFRLKVLHQSKQSGWLLQIEGTKLRLSGLSKLQTTPTTSVCDLHEVSSWTFGLSKPIKWQNGALSVAQTYPYACSSSAWQSLARSYVLIILIFFILSFIRRTIGTIFKISISKSSLVDLKVLSNSMY